MTELCDDACCSGDDDPTVALRELGRFSRTWQHDDLIEPRADETLTRAELEAVLVDRARSDPDFLETLRSETRFAYMVALHNAYGISKLQFLREIREVRLLEETPEVIFLALPARPIPANGSDEAPPGRGEIERRLLERCGQDESFRQALLFEPGGTYRELAREACGGSEPPFLDGVREIRVIPETRDSLALVLPAERG